MRRRRSASYTVKVVDQVNPHPGAEYYVDAFGKAITAKTRLVAVTHVTSTAGDLLPVKELCRLAHDRGALSLVDGAQSFGVLDVDLSDMQPDFYSGSAHKWPCGPKENGVLFVNRRAHAVIAPSVISLYAGSVGISRTLEAFGQRDEPAIMGFGAALAFQDKIGRRVIEDRARELTAAVIEGLKKIDGVKIWTHPARDRSAAIVSFQPASLDVRALYQSFTRKTTSSAPRAAVRIGPGCGSRRTSQHARQVDRADSRRSRSTRSGSAV